jgi:hypothetical protein
MRNPLHIALGDSSEGCLRVACRAHGLPGAAFGIPDDLSHGPLDDGRVRVGYMRERFRGYDDWCLDVTDAFAPWRAMIARLDQARADAVVIWSGDNASEATFLSMACWWLGTRSERVLRVGIPGRDGRHYVAIHTPAELADLFVSARELTDTERAVLAADFLRIRGETGLLRRWEEGRVLGVSMDRYDPLLLASCPPTWTSGPRVVGTAMSRCDGHNRMSDLFFSSRLQRLIDAGRIEADGRRHRLREYRVRLTAA